MKQIFIVTGVLVALISIVVVSLDDNIDDIEVAQSTINLSDNNEKVIYNISSEVTSKTNTQEVLEDQERVKKKKPLDKSVVYSNVDQSRRYGIQVIDESKPGRVGGPTFSINGKIDGNSFTIKVPESLQYSPLKLKVVNIKTKEAKITELTFLSELEMGESTPTLDVSFDDIDNYSVIANNQNSAVFP